MSYRFIPASDRSIRYMGRTDTTADGSVRVPFAGTQITLRFVGTVLRAVITNYRFYNEMELGVLIDGRETKVTFTEDRVRFSLALAEGLERKEHEITLFKRQDATHCFVFHGFETDGDAELLPPRPLSDRRIECYGDSVSAGAVCEAVDFIASNDPENNGGVFDNAYHAYPMITARNLGAEINNIAQGGISVFNGYGYYHQPDTIGMETVFDKVCYFPEEWGYTPWDFSKYAPQVVIFAIGQNDQHNANGDDPDITDPGFRRRWKDGYEKILRELRGHYPKARFILLLTVLMHDPEWDKAIDEITSELNAEGDSLVSHLTFKRCGKATPGHPRLPEQYEMASELTEYISRMGDEVWNV